MKDVAVSHGSEEMNGGRGMDTHTKWIAPFLLVLLLTACGGSSGNREAAENPTSPPDAPESVQAQPSDSAVTLTWGDVTEATQYNIYLAAESGVTPDTYGSLSQGNAYLDVTSPYTLNGLENGTTHYFVVTAENSAGESDPSREARATPTLPAVPSISTPRQGLAAATANGRIYAIGGEHSSPTGSVEEYDPTTNQWQSVAPIIRRTELAAATIDDTIYAIAGRSYSNAGSVFDSAFVELYDAAGDTWGRAENLPTGTYRHTGVVLDGKIYVVDGSIYEYTPSSNSWATVGLVNNGVNHASAAADGKVIVFGGRNTERLVSVFDPATQTVTEGATMPRGRTEHVAANVSGDVYLLGGVSESTSGVVTYPTVADVYSAANDTWRTVETDLMGRRNHAAATLNGRIYLIGGYNGQVLGDTEVFEP